MSATKTASPSGPSYVSSMEGLSGLKNSRHIAPSESGVYLLTRVHLEADKGLNQTRYFIVEGESQGVPGLKDRTVRLLVMANYNQAYQGKRYGLIQTIKTVSQFLGAEIPDDAKGIDAMVRGALDEFGGIDKDGRAPSKERWVKVDVTLSGKQGVRKDGTPYTNVFMSPISE